MTSKEKAEKAQSLFSILEERVHGFLDRNEKYIYRSNRDSLRLKRTFRVGPEGEWDIEVVCHNIEKKKKNFQYSWYAWQKYFVAHGKSEINRGTGFYLLGTIKRNVIFEIPPHLISRFKDRFYDDPENATIDQIKRDIVEQIGLCRAEYVHYSETMTDEERVTWDKYIGSNGSTSVLYMHTMDGQFFGNSYYVRLGNDMKYGYNCLTTYMDNDELRYEQLAYSAEINRKGNSEVSVDEIMDDAKKNIKKVAKTGDVREGLIEQKKKTMLESINESMTDGLMSAIMKIRSHNILQNIGHSAEKKLKKIGLITL